MSLHIDPNLEAEIQQRAMAQGVSTEQLIDHLLHPFTRKPQKPTLTMLLMQSWLEEDATDSPEEIRQAEEDLGTYDGITLPFAIVSVVMDKNHLCSPLTRCTCVSSAAIAF